jgi:Lon protease-like protein
MPTSILNEIYFVCDCLLISGIILFTVRDFYVYIHTPRPARKRRNEKPYSVGTMAEIRNLDRLEDGRYTLMAVGTKRFRIVSERRDKPYLSGLVELYEDDAEPERGWLPAMQQARDVFGEYLGLLLEASEDKNVEAHLPDEAEELSYFIAYFLDIQEERKQQFLELTSTRQRLQEEVAILRREVPFMRQILSKSLSEDLTRLN